MTNQYTAKNGWRITYKTKGAMSYKEAQLLIALRGW